MKKLNLLLLVMLLAVICNAQIKVWSGGGVSVGSTTDAPSGANRTLFKGPVNIKQSNTNQTLITLDATNEPIKARTFVTNVNNVLSRNYVLTLGNANNVFFVNGWGNVYCKSVSSWSDSTLKTQIEDLDSALIKIKQLHGVSYKYKDDVADTSVYGGGNAKRYIGLLAQDVEAIVPEAVDTTDSIMSVNYPSLTGLLIEGIKDLDTKVGRMEYWKKDTATGNVYNPGDKVIIGNDKGRAKLSVMNGDTATINGVYMETGDIIYNQFGVQPEIGILSVATNKADTTVDITADNSAVGIAGIAFNADSADFTEQIVGVGVSGGSYIPWGSNVGLYGEAAGGEGSFSAGVVGVAMGNGFVNVGGSFRPANANNEGDTTINLGIMAIAPTYNPNNDGAFDNNYAGYFGGDALVTGNLYTVSDERLKTDVKLFDDGALTKLNALKVSTYNFMPEMKKLHNLPYGRQVGIMAQDIEKQWPGLVKTSLHMQVNYDKILDLKTIKTDEFKVVNYAGLIPILVKGIQELDATVDTLKAKLGLKTDSLLKAVAAENAILKAENEDLKKDVAGIKDMLAKFGDDLQYCCFNQGTNQHTPTGDNSKLEQNNPNPFSENTTIRYYIAAQSKEVVIRISDLNGTVLNTFKIDAKGAGQILLSGNSLKAGTYIYELIVDGKQIDAKRMLLTY